MYVCTYGVHTGGTVARKILGPPQNHQTNLNYQRFLCTSIVCYLFFSILYSNSLKPLRHTLGFLVDELLLLKVQNLAPFCS